MKKVKERGGERESKKGRRLKEKKKRHRKSERAIVSSFADRFFPSLLSSKKEGENETAPSPLLAISDSWCVALRSPERSALVGGALVVRAFLLRLTIVSESLPTLGVFFFV